MLRLVPVYRDIHEPSALGASCYIDNIVLKLVVQTRGHPIRRRFINIG